MGKKIFRLTENELGDLIIKSLGGSKEEFFSKILSAAKKHNNPELIDKINIDKNLKDVLHSRYDNTLSGSQGDLYELDLNTREGFNAYVKIANSFISRRSSNLLGITGRMLADGAKQAYNKYKTYVPVELALAQLAQEGGFTPNKNARPIKTKNPFNVGNVDSGKNKFHSSVQSAINTYYNLMAKNYLNNKTTDELLNNFVNNAGNRYASDKNYENKIGQIVNSVRNNFNAVYASASKSNTSDLA